MSEFLLILFPALLVVAAVSDLMTMTIPNRLSLAVALLFFPLALVAGFSAVDVGLHVLVGLGTLALTFVMFSFGWIGGGDAKLAAGVAMWFGPALALEWSLYAAVFGGALTMAILMARQVPLPQLLAAEGWIARLHAPKTGIPYGIALAAGGLALYADSAIFKVLAH